MRAPSADLAHEDQARRVWVEHVADELVHDGGDVELGGCRCGRPVVDRGSQNREIDELTTSERAQLRELSDRIVARIDASDWRRELT